MQMLNHDALFMLEIYLLNMIFGNLDDKMNILRETDLTFFAQINGVDIQQHLKRTQKKQRSSSVCYDSILRT